MNIYANAIKTNMLISFLTVAMVLAVLTVPNEVQAQVKKGEIIIGKNIEGYISLVPITCSLYRNDNRLALEGLAEGIRTFTRVTPSLDQNIKLDDQRVVKYPFLYVSTGGKYSDFELLGTEQKSLGRYLKSGGFVLLEFDIIAYRGLKSMLPQDIRLKPVPDSHSIYHEPFDIDTTSWNNLVSNRLGDGLSADLPVGAYLMGLYYKGKLVGVYSDKNVGAWNRRLGGGANPINTNIKFGINMINYATKMYNEKNK